MLESTGVAMFAKAPALRRGTHGRRSRREARTQRAGDGPVSAEPVAEKGFQSDQKRVKPLEEPLLNSCGGDVRFRARRNRSVGAVGTASRLGQSSEASAASDSNS